MSDDWPEPLNEYWSSSLNIVSEYTGSGIFVANPGVKIEQKHFAALDGFRGLLALCVAVYHTFWMSNLNGTAFFNNGPVVIDLFFVFSGFLLFYLYRERLQTGAQVSTFFKKRFARLYPLHLFMFLVFLAFALVRIFAHKIGISTLEPGERLPFEAGAPETLWSVLSNLTLTHSLGVHDSLTFNPPSWTISVEFYAYITFAAFLFWCPPRKWTHIAILAALIALIYGALSALKPNMDITYDYGFWRCLGGFYTGVIGAWLYLKTKDRPSLLKMRTGTASALEVAALMFYIGFVIYCPGKLQFFVAPVALLFIYIFAFDRGYLSRILKARPFQYLAKISYSVYLVHVMISMIFYVAAIRILPHVFGPDWINNPWMGDLYLIPYIGVVLAVSHLTWTFIERPGRSWILGFNRHKTALAAGL